MSNKTTFIGHRILLQDGIEQKLKTAIENEIKNGCKNFVVGSHGEFDKTVCGIALLDSDGNVIYGQIPSVEKCESYDGPNLIMTQYAWAL